MDIELRLLDVIDTYLENIFGGETVAILSLILMFGGIIFFFLTLDQSITSVKKLWKSQYKNQEERLKLQKKIIPWFLISLLGWGAGAGGMLLFGKTLSKGHQLEQGNKK